MIRTFGVWCEVWGGVTGSRAAWLKSNGKVAVFASREEAQEEARRLHESISPHRTAEFRYTAKLLHGEPK